MLKIPQTAVLRRKEVDDITTAGHQLTSNMLPVIYIHKVKFTL